MDTLESKNGENGEHFTDPYYEVVSKDDRNHRLHLHGRSVANSNLKGKGKDKMAGYMFPPEFLQHIKAELIREVAPDLASTIVSQLQAANPGVQLQIPDLLGDTRDTSSANDCPSIDQAQELGNGEDKQGQSGN